MNRTIVTNFNSQLDNLGFETVWDRTFRPHFEQGLKTLFSPTDSQLSSTVSMINTNVTSFDSELNNGLFGSSIYGVRFENSPLAKQYNSNIDGTVNLNDDND